MRVHRRFAATRRARTRDELTPRAVPGRSLQSCRTTLSRELLIRIGRSPSYSMKPSFLNLFRKKFTRERGSPRRYGKTFLAIPAESRKASTAHLPPMAKRTEMACEATLRTASVAVLPAS